MKKFTLTAILIIVVIFTFAQPPQAFKYQTVVRDGAGAILQNQTVSFRMSIREGTATGTIVFRETHSATTNDFGLATFEIGSGTLISGSFSGINWGDDDYYLQTELDPLNGVAYVSMGTSQLNSVPYALHAETSGDSYWELTGNDIYTSESGNVGIGTTNPDSKLSVGGSGHSNYAIFGTGADRGVLGRYNTGTWASLGNYISGNEYGIYTRGNTAGIYAYSGSQTVILAGTGYAGYFSGNVGIATSSPTERLHINGNMRLENAFYDSNNDPGTSGQILQTTGVATDWVDAPSMSDGDWTISGNNLYSSVSGNVGIGASNPSSKLDILDNSLSSTNTVEDILEIARGSTGTVANGIGAGLIFRNQVSNLGYALSGRISSIMESVTVPNSSAGMLFQTRASGGSMTDALYLDPNGNVGLGTTNPSKKLHIVGNINHDLPGTGNALHASGSTGYAMYYIENSYAGNSWGLSAGMTSSSAGSTSYGVYGFNFGTGYGVYGKSYNSSGYAIYGKNDNSGNYGYTGGPNFGIYGYNDAGNSGYIGGLNYAVQGYHNLGNYAWLGTANYGVHAYLTTENVGDFAVYGNNSNGPGADGTDYDYNDVLGGVHGLSFYGNPYTFGVAGHSYLDYNRSGGNLGSDWDGNDWGCLAYQNSGGTEYGGYFTSYTSGSGKDAKAQINNGIGAWGDLFGADIHGKVYGAFIEGENYATYTKGTSFHDGLDVHLQKTGNNNTVLYTNVSTDATVQTSGYATLTNGKSNIAFDEVFTNVVSSETPIVVTVTPVGNSNGVYLAEISNSGFKVVENNEGKSNVTITYIAIGKRAGYENPQLPQEVIDVEYTSKLTRGLHNDGDTETDGEGLYYENGKLIVGIHPSTIANPNRPAPEESEVPVKAEVRENENESSNGRAEEIVSDEQESEDFQIITPQETQPMIEQEVMLQETQPEILTPKAKEVTPKETKPVNRKPNYNTSDGGPERK